MQILWNALEFVDRKAIQALDRLDKKLRREPFQQRKLREIRNVRAPQRVIEFEK
jgi:hypothetical protein